MKRIEDFNKLPTGIRVQVQCSPGGVWIEGEVSQTEGVKKKYISLHNGEEALQDEVKNLRVLD